VHGGEEDLVRRCGCFWSHPERNDLAHKFADPVDRATRTRARLHRKVCESRANYSNQNEELSINSATSHSQMFDVYTRQPYRTDLLYVHAPHHDNMRPRMYGNM